MTDVPRIVRALPTGSVVRAPSPIGVTVTLRWVTGQVAEVEAEALAWTRDAVEIAWRPPGGHRRTDWVAATDVRRTGRTAAAPASAEPPRSTTRHRSRW